MNVVINQPNTLTLDSSVPLDSCYFKVNSDNTYDQAVSSNVQVSKVPIIIDLPNSQTPYAKPSAVPLKVSTTISPVSGIVNLELNCTSMITPYPITIPINIQGTFNYPSTAFGSCRLSVNDPIFE